VPDFVQLPHHFVEDVALRMPVTFVELAFQIFGTLGHLFGQIVHASVVQMLNRNPHVLETTRHFLAGPIMLWPITVSSSLTIRPVTIGPVAIGPSRAGNLTQSHLYTPSLSAHLLQRRIGFRFSLKSALSLP
jgi:hypothetical protein